MINAEYIFDRKIIWLGDKNICDNNVDDFLGKLTEFLRLIGSLNTDTRHTLKGIKRDIYEGGCLMYLRFFDETINFYATEEGGSFEDQILDAKSIFNSYLEERHYTTLDIDELLGDDIDTTDIFNQLNENFTGDSLLGKKIWFQFPVDRSEVESVNRFLIGNGFRGLRDDNIDEFMDMIYDYDVAYFYMLKLDSPLHSEEQKKPYVSYSYMEFPNPHRLYSKPNWIHYKDLELSTDENDDPFNTLNESVEQPEPKVGDYLYCHRNVVMEDDASIEATEGKMYPIISVGKNGVYIKNNSNGEHKFSTDPEENWHYSVWFNLVPAEFKNELDEFNPFDSL
jgi:hypothetical protein